MGRPAVESHELPGAVAWERLRATYFAELGRFEESDNCLRLADWHQARLNKLLKDQINAA